MVKNKLFILLVLSAGFCVQCNYNKKEFYPSGKIKLEEFYYSKYDSIPYMAIGYYKSGEVKDSFYYNSEGKLSGYCYHFDKKENFTKYTTYKNGVRNGVLLVEFKDGRKMKEYFKENVLNGIQTSFDNAGNIESEYLWIEDVPVARRLHRRYLPGDTLTAIVNDHGKLSNFFEIVKDSITSIEYSIIKEVLNSKFEFETIGSLHLKDGKIDEYSKFNSYNYLQLNDTIKYGEALNVELATYLPKDANMHLIVRLGEMDSEFNFKDTVREIQLTKGITSFSFQINNYQKGYNLLIGEVHYLIDTNEIGRTFIFEDFVVVD
jgi:hypothetical protein